MKRLPRLRVKGLGWNDTKELCEFHQAKYFPFDSRDLTIVVEGKAIKSYEDILELASQDIHKDKEFLEVLFLPVIVGG